MKSQLEAIRRFKLQQFQIGRTLGRGGFGKVKIAKFKRRTEADKQRDKIFGQDRSKQKHHDKYFALKMLKKSEIIKAQQIDHVYNQNFVLSQISHPFIVGFEGFAQDSRYIYIVLELINGGELFSYLRLVQAFQTQQARFYAGMVTLIFEYLHSKDIIFRDLKPQNLLISPDGYLKLTDFGFAKILKEGRTFTICGTPQYIAPEVILNQGHGKAVDWWTLGILIYEMHAGIDPFSDEDAMGIYRKILKGKITFPAFLDKSAKQAKSLIKHLLVADLSKRYGNLKQGINDIKKHRWFNNFKWKQLLEKKLKPYYIPKVTHTGDISNFDQYADSDVILPQIKSINDPFLNW